MCVICKKGKKLLFKGLFLILKIKNKKMTCKYNLQVNILNNILFNQICKRKEEDSFNCLLVTLTLIY